MINLRNHRFLLETHACEARAKLASESPAKPICPVPVAPTSSPNHLLRCTEAVAGNGMWQFAHGVIAPLQKM